MRELISTYQKNPTKKQTNRKRAMTRKTFPPNPGKRGKANTAISFCCLPSSLLFRELVLFSSLFLLVLLERRVFHSVLTVLTFHSVATAHDVLHRRWHGDGQKGKCFTLSWICWQVDIASALRSTKYGLEIIDAESRRLATAKTLRWAW